MKKDTRFARVYKQGSLSGEAEILVDKETGVNYIFYSSGYAGGMTVLLDKYGKPVVTPIENQ